MPVYGALAIRANLLECLRGRASAWYSTQLTTLQKDRLRGGDGINNWIDQLTEKFRESATVALNKLTSLKYTTTDARQKHEPANYVYEIVRRAKAAGFDRTVQQLSYAYNEANSELGAFFDEPDSETNIEQLLYAIERKKNAWFDIYHTRQPNRNHNSDGKTPYQDFQGPALPQASPSYYTPRESPGYQ